MGKSRRNQPNPISVTAHRHGFRKMIGGVLFNFGLRVTEKEAVERATTIKFIWDRLRKEGHLDWPTADLKWAQKVARDGVQMPEPWIAYSDGTPLAEAELRDRPHRPSGHLIRQGVPTQQWDDTVPSVHTLHAALDHYLTHKESSQASEGTKQFHRDKIANIKFVIDDVRLSQLDSVELDRQLNRIVDPECKGRRGVMSYRNKRHMLTILRQALEHSHYAKAIDWAEPGNIAKLFRDKRREMSAAHADDDEFGHSEVKHYGMEDLSAIWQRVNERHTKGIKSEADIERRTLDQLRRKCFFLLGLNCGFGETDLATLKYGHLILDNKTPHIARRRHKVRSRVKVRFIWALWPETTEVLREYLSHRGNLEQGDVVFVNRNGEPYSYFRNRPITQMWQRLNDQLPAGIRRYGFYTIRKTGSQLVREIGGREMSELYLGHADHSTGQHYNIGDFKRLAKVLRRVRQRLSFLDNTAVGG